jgi:Holliday junction resolvasome RuvABC DNA-binding subunit
LDLLTAAERSFRLLINTVSGIGPKIALGMSGMSAVALRGAVAQAMSKPFRSLCRKNCGTIVVQLARLRQRWEAAARTK